MKKQSVFALKKKQSVFSKSKKLRVNVKKKKQRRLNVSKPKLMRKQKRKDLMLRKPRDSLLRRLLRLKKNVSMLKKPNLKQRKMQSVFAKNVKKKKKKHRAVWSLNRLPLMLITTGS